MEEKQSILDGYSDMEKGAYLGAIASIATADSEASQEELDYLSILCNSAGLSDAQKQIVIRAATELTGTELNKCLDVLKNSDLKHSLIADMIAFAKADNEYTQAERKAIQYAAAYLGINDKQFSLLDEFADKATHAEPQQNMGSQGFLSSLGLEDKMRSAGINTGGLLKGILSIAAPLLLSRMFSGGRRRFGGGMLGGGLLAGGLGSLIGMLAGNRGYRRSGGFLGGLFGFK
ncbi:MAG: TerB family tellurite resistance protein [Sphingobacteriales bacterium]|nr:MAG: TerB family tellurite resistance protein [Sphingobacteriales bacterium]